MRRAPQTPQPAPAWFDALTAVEATSHFTSHAGARLHYRTWGDREKPSVMLVHGGGAHNHWWDFIAPALVDRYYVIAPDMSGHGDSDHRESYPLRVWAAELMAVLEAAGAGRPPVLVGHSLGGIVSLVAAGLHGAQLRGAVIVDSPVRPPSSDDDEGRKKRIAAFGNPRTYRDSDAAVRAFRLIPPQPCENDFIVRYIARHSVREVEGGVSWKFDPGILRPTVPEAMETHLREAGCPLAFVVGEHSEIVSPATAAHMAELAGPHAALEEIAGAYHHVPLDQPLAFTEVLRRRLSAFDQ